VEGPLFWALTFRWPAANAAAPPSCAAALTSSLRASATVASAFALLATSMSRLRQRQIGAGIKSVSGTVLDCGAGRRKGQPRSQPFPQRTHATLTTYKLTVAAPLTLEGAIRNLIADRCAKPRVRPSLHQRHSRNPRGKPHNSANREGQRVDHSRNVKAEGEMRMHPVSKSLHTIRRWARPYQ
jgi:hypothetical protein